MNVFYKDIPIKKTTFHENKGIELNKKTENLSAINQYVLSLRADICVMYE